MGAWHDKGMAYRFRKCLVLGLVLISHSPVRVPAPPPAGTSFQNGSKASPGFRRAAKAQPCSTVIRSSPMGASPSSVIASSTTALAS